eukprot:6212821-Pleurochrysis_carterae.AAC.3
MRLAPSMSARAAGSATALFSPSASRTGSSLPLLESPSRPHDCLPQFAECHIDAFTTHMHEQLDCCLAALHSLGDINPGTVKKDEAAWRVNWVSLTELLGVAKRRENLVTLMPSSGKHDGCVRCCC